MQTNKPPLPVTIPVLAVVVVIGLVAQFLAAWAAFELVFGLVHAFFAAALIESMVAVEALATARTRSEVALVGLVLGLLTSLIYNYAAADDAAPDLNKFVKGALALGPVLALASVGLALGEEIWRYEEELDTWRAGQIEVRDKVDEQQREFEQAEDAKDREFQRKEQRRERLARQKLERALSGRSGGEGGRLVGDSGRSGGEGGRLVGDNGRSVGAQGAQWAGRWVGRGGKARFLQAVGADPDMLVGLNGPELARRAEMPESTARRWVSDGRAMIEKMEKEQESEKAERT